MSSDDSVTSAPQLLLAGDDKAKNRGFLEKCLSGPHGNEKRPHSQVLSKKPEEIILLGRK